MKVSIKRLSEVTGFSPATVSNALNNKKGVNRETADQIVRAAKELGYYEEAKINRIKIVTFRRHGNVVRGYEAYTSLVQWMEKECRKAGYQTLIYNLDQPEDAFRESLEEIKNDKNSGIILLAAGMLEEDAGLFKDSLAPLVLVDNWFDDLLYDSVLMNNEDAVYHAVNYLIRKGHRKIGYICSSSRIKNFYYREQGYRRALSDNHIELETDFVYPLRISVEESYKDMKDFLSKPHKMPTAFVCDDDLFAFSAMKAITEAGYRIPEDVSVIGFDDLPFCEVSAPRLTSIRVDKQGMAQMAVRRLKDLIDGEYSSKMKIQICTEFIERESVRSLMP